MSYYPTILHGFIFHRKMDRDRDGKIGFTDFRDTVATQPLLMEAFGECLPYNTGKYSQMNDFVIGIDTFLLPSESYVCCICVMG